MHLTTANLNGIIAFSLLYGIYFDLFIGSLYVLIYAKRPEKVNYVILSGTVLQFALITSCYGLRWARIYAAFITHGNRPGGPLLFLINLRDWREVSSLTIWALTSVLGDVMFIYRLYIVWDRRVVLCLVPVALVIGSMVSTVGLLVVLTKPTTTSYTISLSHWAWSSLSINLAQNILVTLLLIARIWWVNLRGEKFVSGSALWSVIIVLLESGALYSSSVLVFLVTYAFKNNASNIMVDMVLPIMGITFNLIIVRVGLRLSKGGPIVVYQGGGCDFPRSGGDRSTTVQFLEGDTSSQSYPLQDMGKATPSQDDSKPPTVSDSYEYP